MTPHQQIAAAIKSKLVIGNPESMHYSDEMMERVVKEFAMKCFEAGYNYATDTSDFPMGDSRKDAPDFDDFYNGLNGKK